jgi:hypothetical protein
MRIRSQASSRRVTAAGTRWRRDGALGLCLLAAAVASGGDEGMPIRNLRLPLGHYEDGSVRLQLKAESARIPPQGDVQAQGARVEIYDRTGKIETLMLADELLYNRTTGNARSDSPVRMERGNMVITGRGLTWNSTNQIVNVLKDAKVVYTSKPGAQGAFFSLPGRKRSQE